jgi:6-phosphogluconolactonase
LQSLAKPFTVSLLGMGEDGHFASLFPDFPGLSEALDPGNEARCITVQTAGSPHLRISLTLAALVNSVRVVLLIFGAEKRKVFDLAADGATDYPIESLLKHIRSQLTVIWAP